MVLVGRILRPQHNRGEVVVASETDFPETRFAVGERVQAAGGALKAPRELTITSFRLQDGKPIVGFAGIGSISEAETLRGCDLTVPDDALPVLGEGQFWRHDLVGCQVVTTSGRTVGMVVRVDDGAAPLLVVDPGGQLIPMVDAICRRIDIAAKRIEVDPPEGLLEL